MRKLNKSYLALIVVAAMGLSACDGDDGKDGEDGTDGISPTLPTTTTEVSEVTNVEYISHTIGEGQVTVEFYLTDEDGTSISGLENATLYLAAMTDEGINRSRDDTVEGSVGGSVTIGGETPTDGATITEVDDGQYTFVAPMTAVQVDTDALIRLQVGDDDGDIASSPYIIIDKPEMMQTTTTETCYSCHVDYATSDIRHSRYVALNTDGEVDFIGGCMVCHTNVSETSGGYAENTMQMLGHISHQKFEKDFTVTNCYTCHAEAPMNTSMGGNGCVDCHGTNDSAAMAIVAAQTNDEWDSRAYHVQSDSIGLAERDEIRANHYTTLSNAYYDDDMEEWAEYYTPENTHTVGYCADLKLFDSSGETDVQLNIGEMYTAEEIAYTGVYFNSYENDSLVARIISHGAQGYIDQEDGTRTVCYGGLVGDFENAEGISGSSRLTIKDSHWEDEDGKLGVAFTSYSNVVDPVDFEQVQVWERRNIIAADGCTTCHNDGTPYHKNGGYVDGGADCVACHNNGQNRSSVNSAPGFGPMVHSMHWGVGNSLSGSKVDEDGNFETNSAASLNADNCVSCHSEGISLADIPNQYMLSRAFNDGTSGVMTSPITANCFACHDNDSALNHMKQNGGEFNTGVTDTWFTDPTSESCATCHDTGKTFGIDKYHVFER